LNAFTTGENKKYKLQESSASCNFSEILNIIFGGFSSRFWMLNKHINQLEKLQFFKNEVPFKSWECITLQLKHRDVDLIIDNEKTMKMFLKILIYKMNTIDGSKDSGKKVKEIIYRGIKKQLAKKKKSSMIDNEMDSCCDENIYK